MKLLVECAVEGNVTLLEPIVIAFDEFEYRFEPDSEGVLTKVSVMASIKYPEKFRSSIEPGSGTDWEISVSLDEALLAVILRKLQALESHISFRLPVERIRWDSPRHELIFETEEERRSQGVYAVHLNFAKTERQKKVATPNVLRKSIFACDRFASMTTPLAFVREGNNEYRGRRFINAYYSYYFVLEGLYGGGRWRNDAVAESFAASPNFRTAVGRACQEAERMHRVYRQLLADMEKRVGGIDAEFAARYLARVRGRLHHFANRGVADEPTPFSHDRFEAQAFFVRAIATFAVLEEMKNISKLEGA